MFSKQILRCFFALIKANKPKLEPNLTTDKIDRCRELFGMNKCLKVNL